MFGRTGGQAKGQRRVVDHVDAGTAEDQEPVHLRRPPAILEAQPGQEEHQRQGEERHKAQRAQQAEDFIRTRGAQAKLEGHLVNGRRRDRRQGEERPKQHVCRGIALQRRLLTCFSSCFSLGAPLKRASAARATTPAAFQSRSRNLCLRKPRPPPRGASR